MKHVLLFTVAGLLLLPFSPRAASAGCQQYYDYGGYYPHTRVSVVLGFGHYRPYAPYYGGYWLPPYAPYYGGYCRPYTQYFGGFRLPGYRPYYVHSHHGIYRYRGFHGYRHPSSGGYGMGRYRY